MLRGVTGLNEAREYNNYRGKKKYPWSGTSTRSSKRKNEGDQLANFKQGKGDYSGVAGWSSDNADIELTDNQAHQIAPPLQVLLVF